MNTNLPDLQAFIGSESDRLSGINSWKNLENVGKNNLERIIQLAQENIYRMLSDHDDAKEMTAIRRGIDFIQNVLIPKSIVKPTLPKLRNEMFRKDDSVCAYLGDTIGTIIKTGWMQGKVADINKAFNKDWKDGKANSGYFWKVTVEFEENIFQNGNKISFSTTEPRVILDWEYDYLKNNDDPNFLQCFSDNAFREWKPLWCIEKELQCEADKMNMKGWIKRVKSCFEGRNILFKQTALESLFDILKLSGIRSFLGCVFFGRVAGDDFVENRLFVAFFAKYSA